ncbi:hypothetical protein ACPYPG_18365 [Streptomyces sp. FR-108]|uniref:hypothetical protein n=1 Tax=Streptomyces sp. FR-108 TaxID=3416665 RepID=UPI003CE99457
MTMPMDNVNEHAEEELTSLAATVEQIRKASYPDLDQRLVAEILEIQRRFSEDRAEARKRTEQLISQWVAADMKSGG